MREYMSIAVRNNLHFVLYHYCCKDRYYVNIYLKCLEKSTKSRGNLLMTREWPVCWHLFVLALCLVNDSSLRGGFLLNFLDDGQGMTQGITQLTDHFCNVSVLTA